MDSKPNNFIQCKINTINSYESITKERPFENIILNLSGGASCFKGRSQFLENIRLHFKSHENKMVVIHGAPGLGKTETARQFAINNSRYYNGNLILIFAETQNNIKECFKNLANILDLKTHDVSQIYSKFKSTRCLFIFDNVENMRSIREYLPVRQLHPTVDILITSQFSQWDSSVNKVALEPLSLEDSIHIFEAKLGDKYRENDIRIWEDLVKYLEGIPLSLQIVSSLFKDEFSKVHITKFKVEEFINDLKVQFINSKVLESEINSYNETVFSSIRFALDRLKKEDTCHALDVLCFIAYLNADFINHIDLLLLPSIEKSEEKLERALTESVKHSLIQVEHDNETGRLKIKIHRTIQLVLRKYDINEQNGSMFKTVLKTALRDRSWYSYESLFKNVNDKEFKNKLLEFCNENKTLVNALLLKLAFYQRHEVLQDILPKIIKEHSVTKQIINDMLKEALYVVSNNMFTIELLVEKYGAKIEISNNETNGLHLASRWLSIGLLNYLLDSSDHKNIINSKNSNGKTSLHLLLFAEKRTEHHLQNTIECMDHLIFNWKADISIRDYNNYNILHTACLPFNANIRLIRYLVEEHNCKNLVNTQNNDGETPLQLFCRFINFIIYTPDSLEIVSYLLKDCEADITITSPRGWNTLFYICYCGTSEIINFVLSEIECRKFINNQDIDGNVALTKLIKNPNNILEEEKIKLLKLFNKNEMNFQIRNNENKTLVEIAKEENFLKLSDELKKYVESSSSLDLHTSNVLNE